MIVKFTVGVESLGQCLALRRKEKNLSIEELGQLLGVPYPTLNKVEEGKNFFSKWIIPVATWCELDPFQLWKLLEVEANRGKPLDKSQDVNDR